MPSSKGHITQGQAVHALNDVSHKVCVKEAACQVASELWFLIISTTTIIVSGAACKGNKMTHHLGIWKQTSTSGSKVFWKESMVHLPDNTARTFTTYSNWKRQPEEHESSRKFIYCKETEIGLAFCTAGQEDAGQPAAVMRTLIFSYTQLNLWAIIITLCKYFSESLPLQLVTRDYQPPHLS